MSLSVQQKIDHAKIILFRKDFNLQFFGLTLYNFKWDVVDFGHEKVLARITLSKDYGDQNKKNKIIYLNERIIEREDYTPINLVFDLWHEILHFIHKHGIRKKEKDKEIYNLACDHIIDLIISKQEKIKPYKDIYNIINQYKYDNFSEEQIYQKLYTKFENNNLTYDSSFSDENEDDQDIESNNNNNDNNDNNNDNNENEDDQDIESNDNNDNTGLSNEIANYIEKFNEELTKDKNEELKHVKTTEFNIDNKQKIKINTIEKHNPNSQSNQESISEILENIDEEIQEEELYDEVLNEIKILYDLTKDKPESIPDQIKSYLGDLLKVEIDWKTIYEKALKNQIKYKFNGVCWRRINPRYTHLNITLPVPNNQKKEANKLNIFLDVSGSVTTKQKRQFGYISYTAFNYFEEISIYYHNTNIVDSKSFSKSDNKHSFLDYISYNKIPDGGGTDHRCCYAKIKEDLEKHNNTSLSIFLTDGWSNIQNCQYNYNDIIKNHPMIFLISNNKNFNFNKNNEYKNVSIIFI